MGQRPAAVREAHDKWILENTELILSMYNDGHSINYIQKLCPIKIGRFSFEQVLIKNKIHLRGLKQNGGLKPLELAKQTSLSKFGYENASSSPVIKTKREKTLQTRYGVSNPFQDEIVKQKSKITLFERYGVYSAGMLATRTTTLSHPHRILLAQLIKNNYDAKAEHLLTGKWNLQSRYVKVDIICKNTVIEVYGDYFHANPQKYKPNDLISRFSGKVMAEQIWQQDEDRQHFIESLGYNFISVWEYDIKNNLDNEIERVKNAIN